MSNDRPDNKERKCSHCNDSGMVERYNKDGDVTSTPCPKCTDVMSHIRNWDWKGQMFDG
jgi:hypothetical protein